MQKILKAIQTAGIFPVVEIERLEDAVPVAKALKDGGIAAMEITLRTDVACDAIKAVLEAFPDMLVGAGTVLTPEQVEEVQAAGACYIVTPGFNPRVVRHCVDNDFLIIPGIDSPTGIELALEAGLPAVKFFPAESRGGMKGLTSMAGPFKKRMKFLPLGGISPDNITDYAQSDAVLAVGGTWIAKQKYIRAGQFEQITKNAKEAMALLHGFELVSAEIGTGADEVGSNMLNTLAMAFAPSSIPGLSPLAATGDAPGTLRIACNNVLRAAVWLESLGQQVKTIDTENNSVWMAETAGGIAIQLIEKQ
ncbi:bifunctional 4-hydroxy-2-oxoglutarate aldolase/2-dehydro-3-deoxy-phosphogluconate aldolase [Pseudodesulfovibrio sp. JC047]|uniref:bifunctional 4-hydroxy-2-oxoglutarate aldolase/2-dehydro-3-deoxy-phosphogluconate aldolase n=1 Tax=Pseudodesulfovibrio sp. JC047 TaxID=2683199 RepID=UPI0013D6B3DB|nr:bifunctional 4-hydroxy-2-oxoglutarate aldolase/2-dehydro-3-deoxy-phosphogluconate aldolase [Pseudodesulfovibrio sp. JC047]NDV19037.1 bifunctional 4-hydroxy-2-oxoglutarate aldolase/2-dehydro-3-deoxy-phosphogluconate aldolase [Pseudodesulfovibrio sp. JC047]